MSGETPQESTTERSNYENESSDTSKEQSECTTTKIGQIKTVTEKTTHSTVTITTTKTPGRTETKTESKVTETITVTEEGGQTPAMTNTTNEEERPELSDHDVKEEESSEQSGVRSKTANTPSPDPQPVVGGGGRRLNATTPSPDPQPVVGGGAPVTTSTTPVQKGQEFKRAFEITVRPWELKCGVLFQEKITLGEGKKQRSCTVNALFRNKKKAAVVDLKNYTSQTYVTGDHIDELASKMAIVKEKFKCTTVWGYIYTDSAKWSSQEETHAENEGITILRKTEKPADMFAHDIDEQLLTE